MKAYEIINPSDNWSFFAPNDEVACMVNMLLGNGRTAIEDVSRRTVCPLMMFMGGDEQCSWWEKTFGCSITDSYDKLLQGVELEAALRSLRCVSVDKLASLPAMNSKKAKKFNDERRSSINDYYAEAISHAVQCAEQRGNTEAANDPE